MSFKTESRSRNTKLLKSGPKEVPSPRIVWHVGPQALWDAFQKVHPLWFVAGVISAVIPSLLGIFRWRWIFEQQIMSKR